jgi:hypothetical protein
VRHLEIVSGERIGTFREVRGFPGGRYQLAVTASVLVLSCTTFLTLRYATLLGDAVFASSWYFCTKNR